MKITLLNRTCIQCGNLFEGTRRHTKCSPCKIKNKKARKKKDDAKYRKKHRARILKEQKKYREKNKEKVSAAKKKCYQKRKEYYKAKANKWYANNKERRLLTAKRWAENNPERVRANYLRWVRENREHIREYKREYLEKNPQAKLGDTMRRRMLSALKAQNASKNARSMEYIGCTVSELYKYLENKFTEGMSWDNHGQFGWHIDHIVPLSSFDLSIEEEKYKAFHYTNCQPLWWYDNLSKGARLDWETSFNATDEMKKVNFSGDIDF